MIFVATFRIAIWRWHHFLGMFAMSFGTPLMNIPAKTPSKKPHLWAAPTIGWPSQPSGLMQYSKLKRWSEQNWLTLKFKNIGKQKLNKKTPCMGIILTFFFNVQQDVACIGEKNMWAIGYLGHRFQTLGLQHFSLPRTVIPEAEAVRKRPSGRHPPGSEPLSYTPLVEDWFQWMIQINSLFINQWPGVSKNIQELEGIVHWKGWSYSELLKGLFSDFSYTTI